MAKYVDGFVIPIPKRSLAAYRRIATLAKKVWLDHGALDYRECIAEDLDSHCGVPFPVQLSLKRGETVVFAYIVYRSRKERDRVNAAVAADPRMARFATVKMPFDMERMVTGGFTSIVGD